MREVVGFAAGVTVTAAASVLLRSEAGRRLVKDLVSEAEPEFRLAAEEWRPLLREVARAVKLGAREVAGAVDVLEGHLTRLAAEAEARSTADADTESTADAEPTVDADTEPSAHASAALDPEPTPPAETAAETAADPDPTTREP